MHKEKIHFNDNLTVWLNTLAAGSSSDDKIAACSLIANLSIPQLKSIVAQMMTPKGKTAANAFVNEMSMVVVAINQYHELRFKENYHAELIVSKTRKALKQLSLNMKEHEYFHA